MGMINDYDGGTINHFIIVIVRNYDDHIQHKPIFIQAVYIYEDSQPSLIPIADTSCHTIISCHIIAAPPQPISHFNDPSILVASPAITAKPPKWLPFFSSFHHLPSKRRHGTREDQKTGVYKSIMWTFREVRKPSKARSLKFLWSGKPSFPLNCNSSHLLFLSLSLHIAAATDGLFERQTQEAAGD